MTVLVLPRIPRVSGIILGANNGVDPFKSPINTTKRATRCGGFARDAAPRRARCSARLDGAPEYIGVALC